MNQHVLLQKRKADTQERKTQELQNENLSILKWLCHEVLLKFFYFIKPTHLGPK